MHPDSAEKTLESSRPQTDPRRRRVLIVAGEASGDLHGADLAAQILARDPKCEIFGVAGARMRAAGVRALINTEDIAGLGVAELTSTIRSTFGAFRAMRKILRSDPPDLVILIDYAEFNLMLAGSAKRGRVSFVGHPLLDRVAPAQGRAETLARHGFPPRARLLAILPGSRRGEIRYLLRPMLEAARVLAADHDLTPAIALAPTLTSAHLRAAAHDTELDGIHIIEGDTYSIIAASELALVASGTATLETALLGCPMVIAYKVSSITYSMARLLVRGVDFIGMPNILAGRRIVPELIQRQVTARNLVRAAEPMLAESLHAEVSAALKSVRAHLGAPGAAGRVAAMALEMMA